MNTAVDVRGLPTRAQFFSRLRRRDSLDADALDRELERRCVRELTVMMIDSSGFTRRTHEHGILHALSVMMRAYDDAAAVVARHGGSALHHGADSLLGVFATPAAGADAAVNIQRRLAARNRDLSERDRFHACIGLHHGKLLRLRDDVYGDKVNVAAKIGEDLASQGEILVTGELARRLPARFRRRYARSVELGGRSFELHEVFWNE